MTAAPVRPGDTYLLRADAAARRRYPTMPGSDGWALEEFDREAFIEGTKWSRDDALAPLRAEVDAVLAEPDEERSELDFARTLDLLLQRVGVL